MQQLVRRALCSNDWFCKVTPPRLLTYPTHKQLEQSNAYKAYQQHFHKNNFKLINTRAKSYYDIIALEFLEDEL